ncbi:hypothetical protein CAPTEDRAFT_216265 [Capitella teleta]|uniref:Amiloride-sensitive sodium channel n=1 Tax=Capitella teleta TaxID=283909 RepID=R7VLE8_CAPTE|nr:hypothetical protein CAPTEDRAFT_216265 [Capitella teleta]|eukprot:ELU18181.1 hypothetical protein CAPTEDRAFT_216265 [Capitella teleta]
MSTSVFTWPPSVIHHHKVMGSPMPYADACCLMKPIDSKLEAGVLHPTEGGNATPKADTRERMALREEVRRFCETSSIKGVPRVISSDGFSLKTFWSLAVIGLFGVAGFQAYQLVTSFLMYPVVTSFYEKPFHPMSFIPRIPIMTICNQNPIVSQPPRGVPSLKDYYQTVNELLACNDDCSPDEIERRRSALRSLTSENAYFQNIGLNAAQSMGITNETLFAHCEIIAFAAVEEVRVPCADLVRVEQHFLKYFFNCYDIVVLSDALPSGSIILGVEVVLNFANPGSTRLTSGARIFLSEQGALSAALMPVQGTIIPAGNDVCVNLHPTLREREKAPYGDCTNYSGSTFVSQYHCFDKCFDDHIKRDCNCVEPSTPVLSTDDEAEYCLKLQASTDRLIDIVLCREGSLNKRLATCLDECLLPCEETQGNIGVHMSTWPSMNQLPAFYESFIQNKSFESSYLDVKKAIDVAASTNAKESFVQLDNALRRVRDNFVRMTIKLTDHRVFLLKDIKKIHLSELGSQLGGALNLWSGVTIIVVLELAELVYRLMRRMSVLEKPATAATSTQHCATCKCTDYPLDNHAQA